MGTDITTFQLSLKKLRELCLKGSTHRVEIVEKHKARLASLDESFHRGEEPARDLLSELLRGKQGTPISAHKTAYVLEILCDHVGKRLHTRELTFLLRPLDNFFSFVEIWKQTKIPFAIENIGEGPFQPPVPLLAPSSWPNLTTFEAEEVKAAHRAIQEFHQEKGPGWKRFNQLTEEFDRKLPEVKALKTWIECHRFRTRCAQDPEECVQYYLSVELEFLTAISGRSNEEWEGHFEDQVNNNFPNEQKYLPVIRELFEVIEEAAKAREGLVMFAY